MFTIEISYSSEFGKVRIQHVSVDTLTEAEYYTILFIKARVDYVDITLAYLYGETYVAMLGDRVIANVEIKDYQVSRLQHGRIYSHIRRNT